MKNEKTTDTSNNVILYKVYELESNEENRLYPVDCHYFCSEICQDKYLAPCERLWSEVFPALGEQIGKQCKNCGKSWIK